MKIRGFSLRHIFGYNTGGVVFLFFFLFQEGHMLYFLEVSIVTVVGGNKLDGLLFETWIQPFERVFVDYFISVVW
jgi:hypothetical protein